MCYGSGCRYEDPFTGTCDGQTACTRNFDEREPDERDARNFADDEPGPSGLERAECESEAEAAATASAS